MVARRVGVPFEVSAADHRQRWRQPTAATRSLGATVWLTGLPGSGKTTLARAVDDRLRAGGRPAVVLDGDELRRDLCADLGFSRADRAENARRASSLAVMVAEAGTVALVAIVSPYVADRAAARMLHTRAGVVFIEAWVNRPLAECERSDPKGLYARARRGALLGLTGVDGPYQAPRSPELEIRPQAESLERSVARIVSSLPGGAVGPPDGWGAARPSGHELPAP